MKKYRIIVPSWSPLSVDMQAETGSQYPAFIQLGGQSLYTHIVRIYESVKNEAEIFFVLPEHAPDLLLNNLVDFDVSTIRLAASRSIGDTVLSALVGVEPGQLVVVHMADTLLESNWFEGENDVICVQLRSDLYRWTSVQKNSDGAIRVLTDRDHISAGFDQMVCVGVFMLSDGDLFKCKLNSALAAPKTGVDPFFSAIETYSNERAIELKTPDSWYDCGHIDSYYESRMSFHNLRHFNTLSYDAERGLVTKRSQNSEAFRHQVRWFKQVPDELASFLPRIYDSSDGSSPHITMELLSIPTLGDLLVNNRLELGAWNDVARKIHHIHSLMHKYSFTSAVAEKIATEVYVGKTRVRIQQFCVQRPEAAHMWVSVSDQRISLNDVLETLDKYAEQAGLLSLESLAPIHGDMCFSNLMYDTRGRLIKLIDPRGEFSVPGIYGDPRYDKAKLMHSYAGGYDFIVSDHFDVNVESSGCLNCVIARDEYHLKVQQIFDSALFTDNRDRMECDAIQSLLFLSMLPLHCDKPTRQLAMLFTGLNLYGQNLKSRMEK
jgi:hypothetical protein